MAKKYLCNDDKHWKFQEDELEFNHIFKKGNVYEQQGESDTLVLETEDCDMGEYIFDFVAEYAEDWIEDFTLVE